jgi:hypothetical protein
MYSINTSKYSYLYFICTALLSTVKDRIHVSTEPSGEEGGGEGAVGIRHPLAQILDFIKGPKDEKCRPE